jgi:tetratricopeptide (TPR) repeat protein
MSVRTTDPRPNGAASERDLLARLGLGPGASNGDIEAAHDEILDFLAAAPGSLRGWAAVQLGTVDEAYAQLNGAPASASAIVPAVPAARAASRPVAARPTGGIDGDDLDGFFDHDDAPVVVTRRERQRRAVQRTVEEPAARRFSLRTIVTAVGAVGVLAGAFVIYQLGAPAVPGFTGTPAPGSSAVAVDPAKVAALMAKLQANPKDLAALRDLGNLYYDVRDFASAAGWMEKIIAIDPKDEEALLALGAAKFNLGDLDGAEATWLRIVAINPKNAEAHYDLGFIYFSKTPPDMARVREEWNKVIAIDPTSDIAKTAATHLQSLDKSSGAPSTVPGASSGPAASAAPVASPAAS